MQKYFDFAENESANQKLNENAKLKSLEAGLSDKYRKIEDRFCQKAIQLENIKITLKDEGVFYGLTSELRGKINAFLKEKWAKNYRFGVESTRPSLEGEALRQRVKWLSFEENLRINELEKTIAECEDLICAIVPQLAAKAREAEGKAREAEDKAREKGLESRILMLEIENLKLREKTGSMNPLWGPKLDLMERITPEDRKTIYHTLCKAFHPDKSHGCSEEERKKREELLKVITSWWGEYSR